MVMLFFVEPSNYISCILYLLIGCLILGFGVYTEVLANVAMLPGEFFVRAVSSTWKTEFGTTKVAFDVSLTVIAAGLSFLFAHRLDGVREGTIIAALLVGFIARLFGRKFEKAVAKYDKNPTSELLDLSNEVTSETASVYMEIGIQVGVLLMMDMIKNIR